jgi:transposase
MSDRTFTSSLPPSTGTVDLLGIPGMRVWWCQEFAGERRLLVDTVARVEPCLGCGQRAESKGRATVEVRDLPLAGKPTRLVWVKRVWRCRDCRASWRETHPEIAPRAVWTGRARREAARQARL